MKVSKILSLLFLVVILWAGCGRETEQELSVSPQAGVVKKGLGGIPAAIELFKAGSNWFILYSLGRDVFIGEKKGGSWYWRSLTEETGAVRSWNGTVCGGKLELIIEKEDNRLYLAEVEEKSTSLLQIDTARFSSAGVHTSIMCDKDGDFHIAVYDPLLGALFYYSGREQFDREKIVEAGEMGLYPIVRVTDFGRVYIAYLDGDSGHIWLTYKDPGNEWRKEDTGVQGSRFSFEIEPPEGGDLSQVFPRIAASDPYQKGIYYAERVSSAWHRTFISTGSYSTFPTLFISPLQTGIVFQNSYWQDLMLATYDGYEWNIDVVDSRGATGYKPALVLSGDELFIAYYSLSLDSILLVEVPLPWQ